MAEAVEGVVEFAGQTLGPGGKWKKLSLKVKGTFYSGFINKKGDGDDREVVKEGDTVKLEYINSDDGRYKNISKVTITGTQTTKDVQPKQSSAGNTTSPATASSEYVPSNVRDLRITIAGARNTAIEFVRLALDKEVIALKAKQQGKRIDELLEHVNHYTEVFAKQLLSATEATLIPVESKTAAVAAKEDDEFSE